MSGYGEKQGGWALGCQLGCGLISSPDTDDAPGGAICQAARSANSRDLYVPSPHPGCSLPCLGGPGESLFWFLSGQAAPWVLTRSGECLLIGTQGAVWQLCSVGTGHWAFLRWV